MGSELAGLVIMELMQLRVGGRPVDLVGGAGDEAVEGERHRVDGRDHPDPAALPAEDL